jgi:hypothetical protein
VSFLIRMPLVPFKLNQNCRHHIPRQRHQVTNWPDYEASLRQRGSLTVWFTEEAIAAWTAEPRTTRGGLMTMRDPTASAWSRICLPSSTAAAAAIAWHMAS